MDRINLVRRLSFTRLNDDVLQLWVVTPTARWADDNITGLVHADNLIQYIQDNGCPNLLGQVASAMTSLQPWSGIEVGFFHRLAEHACR